MLEFYNVQKEVNDLELGRWRVPMMSALKEISNVKGIKSMSKTCLKLVPGGVCTCTYGLASGTRYCLLMKSILDLSTPHILGYFLSVGWFTREKTNKTQLQNVKFSNLNLLIMTVFSLFHVKLCYLVMLCNND